MTKSTTIDLSDFELDTVVSAVYDETESGHVEIDGLYITCYDSTMDYTDYIYNYIRHRVAIRIEAQIADRKAKESTDG